MHFTPDFNAAFEAAVNASLDNFGVQTVINQNIQKIEALVLAQSVVVSTYERSHLHLVSTGEILIQALCPRPLIAHIARVPSAAAASRCARTNIRRRNVGIGDGAKEPNVYLRE
jgi:hypothetical protein